MTQLKPESRFMSILAGHPVPTGLLKLEKQFPFSPEPAKVTRTGVQSLSPEAEGVFSRQELEVLLSQMTPHERRTGKIRGVPINQIREALAQAQQDEQPNPRIVEQRRRILLRTFRGELNDPKDNSPLGIKSMILNDRAASYALTGNPAQLRGSKADIKYIKEEAAKLVKDGRIIPQNPAPSDGLGNKEVSRKLEAQINRTPGPIKLQVRQAAKGDRRSLLEERLTSVLQASTRLNEAEEAINKFRASGKAFGSGWVGDQATVHEEGLRVFKNGATRGQRQGSQPADETIPWSDFANGTATIGLAPTGLDGVRGLFKRLRGKPDDLPGTIVIVNKATQRTFKVTTSKAAQLVDALRVHAPVLAQSLDIRDRYHDAMAQDPALTSKILNAALDDK